MPRPRIVQVQTEMEQLLEREPITYRPIKRMLVHSRCLSRTEKLTLSEKSHLEAQCQSSRIVFDRGLKEL